MYNLVNIVTELFSVSILVETPCCCQTASYTFRAAVVNGMPGSLQDNCVRNFGWARASSRMEVSSFDEDMMDSEAEANAAPQIDCRCQNTAARVLACSCSDGARLGREPEIAQVALPTTRVAKLCWRKDQFAEVVQKLSQGLALSAIVDADLPDVFGERKF